MSYTNLTYLKNITDGNKEVIGEIVAMFAKQVPEFVQNFNRFYQSGQFEALGKEAHKAKSSLQILGMSELEKEMKVLQLKAIEGKEPESYLLHIRHFEEQCKAAIDELEQELGRL